MNYSSNKAIYLQIADNICDKVISGEFEPLARVPSVRELSAAYEVNVNTVMRSIDYLAANGIIYNQRGIGYFLCDNAKEKILNIKRESFLKGEIRYFFRQIQLLGIDGVQLQSLYNQFINETNNQQ